MDAVTLGMAKAATERAVNGGNAALAMKRLEMGVENVTMLVLGDSTGAIGAAPWPLLVAQWLAAKYPAYTVNYYVWSDAGQAWKALGSASGYPTGNEQQTSSQVIQTGTGTGNGGGPFVLNVYNGSVSGTSATYPNATLSRWNAMVGTPAPQLVFVNFGHNHVSAGDSAFRRAMMPLFRNLEHQLPEAGIVLCAQNPRSQDSADTVTNSKIRNRVLMTLAGTEGYGLVNFTQRFLSSPTWKTDWVLGDGLYVHPNPAGSAVMAQEVEAHLTTANRSVPRGPSGTEKMLWIPAQQFVNPAGGSLAQVNGQAMGWACPSGVRTDLVASRVIPTHWAEFDLFIKWTFPTTASQAVAWASGTRSEGLGITDVQTDQSTGIPVPAFTINQASPFYVTSTRVNQAAFSNIGLSLTGSAPVPGRPMGLQITRRGDVTTADTYTGTTYLYGALLARKR